MADFLNGYRDGGQDWSKVVWNSYVDATPSTTGVLQSNNQFVLANGDAVINFSGVTGKKVVVSVPATYDSPRFSVTDLFGGAAGTNIVLSGAAGTSYTFNGATTYSMSTAYGRVDAYLVTGVLSTATGAWIVK